MTRFSHKPVSAADQRHLNEAGKWAAIHSVVIGVDAIVRDLELIWGCGRLITLVSDDTRVRFQRGHALWSAALAASDLEQVQALGPKIIAAWRFMAKEADALGQAPLSPEVWEARMPDGAVLAITRTLAESLHVAADGRKRVVYSLDEVARILHQHTLVETIKREFEGATVARVTTHAEGFASAWATDASTELFEMEDA